MSTSLDDSTEERSSSWSDGFRGARPQSTTRIPSMNLHTDFISFLAIAQYYEIDFVSLMWEQGRGRAGLGGTSEVWQSNANRRNDFVFKRTTLADKSRPNVQDEEKAFNAMVSEISVLSHPQIRHHQNIVNLEGISWEIPERSHKVWPVLVLEKAQLGDLKSFMSTELGRSTTIHERLELCTDIASAIITLHANDPRSLRLNLSHGDIKPANVLVFKDGTGQVFAKLADFGYAGWARGSSKDVLIKPPKSWPWNPPEYHHRGFTVPAARKLDMYSFGLLCLWVLFSDKAMEFASASKATWDGRTWPLENFGLLDSMKHSDSLRRFATSLVSAAQDISTSQREDLSKFFSSALMRDPKERKIEFKELSLLLGQPWQPGPTSMDAKQIEMSHNMIRFDIVESFYPLMKAHYQLRSYIFSCFVGRATADSSEIQRLDAAFQTGFCYKIGFGIAADEMLARYWLEKAQRPVQDLEAKVNRAKATPNMASFRNGELQHLEFEGLLGGGPTSKHESEELLNVAAVYGREIRDFEHAFGKYNAWIIEFKLKQASILEDASEYKDAESLRIQLLQDLRIDKGYLRLSTNLDNRPVTQSLERKRWLNREGSPKPPPPLKIPDLTVGPAHLVNLMACWNEKIPESVHMLHSLCINYMRQGRWREAEWLFLRLTTIETERLGQSHPESLHMTSTLATIYVRLGDYSMAVELYRRVNDITEWILGPLHRNTLRTKTHLALTYQKQNRLEKAERLILEVLDIQRAALGNEDFSTCESMGCLSSIYLSQGRLDPAKTLTRQVVEIRTRTLGSKHLETLTALSRLVEVLAKQARWSEAMTVIQPLLQQKAELLRPEHPDLLLSKQHLAAIQYHLGLYGKAETGFKLVLKARSEDLGEAHPDVIDSTVDLGAMYVALGRFKEAERVLIKASEASRKCYGEEHPRSLQAASHLGFNYLCQSRLKDAEDIYMGIHALGKKVWGSGHPDQLEHDSILAEVYLGQGRSKEAEQLARQALEGLTKILGKNHGKSMDVMVRLVMILHGQRRWPESDSIILDVIEYRKKTLGGEHNLTYSTMRFYATSLWHQSRWREASAVFYQSSRLVRSVRHLWTRRNGVWASAFVISTVVLGFAVVYGRS